MSLYKSKLLNLFSFICGLFIGLVFSSIYLIPVNPNLPVNTRSISVKKINKCNYKHPNGPRILCSILIDAQKDQRYLIRAIYDTWMRKCDKFLLFKGSNKIGNNIQKEEFKENIIELDFIDKSKTDLTDKIIKSLMYVYENHLEEFDWFMKADLDTFVLMENLKYFLVDKCANEKFTYGRHFRKFNKNGYLDGGSSYLISRESIRLFGDSMKKDKEFCVSKEGLEDVELAGCLAKLNIVPGISKDKFGKERFHFTNISEIWDYNEKWLYDYSDEVKHGNNCCSDSSIGFHRVSGSSLYQYYYMIYKLKPHYFDFK